MHERKCDHFKTQNEIVNGLQFMSIKPRSELHEKALVVGGENDGFNAHEFENW
jgi:hypothetical protein